MCSRSVFCSDPAVLYSQVCPYLSVASVRLHDNGLPGAPASPHLNLCYRANESSKLHLSMTFGLSLLQVLLLRFFQGVFKLIFSY